MQTFYSAQSPQGAVSFRYAILLWCFLIVQAGSLWAQSPYTWTGGGMPGNWADDANWSGVGIPGAGDVAIFSGVTVSISLNLPVNLGILTITASAQVTFAPPAPVTINLTSFSIAAGSSLTLGGQCAFTQAAACSVNGILSIAANPALNPGANITVNSGGELIVVGAADIGSSTPSYVAGSTLRYIGAMAKILAAADNTLPSPISTGMLVVIDNTMGVTLDINRMLNGTLLVMDNRTLTIANTRTLSVSATGSVQMLGANPNIVQAGTGNIAYIAGATLEYVGGGNDIVGGEVPKPVLGISTMNGNILVNKTAGGSVTTAAEMLIASGDFIVNSGAWNVSPTSILRLQGPNTSIIQNGAALIIQPNGVAEVIGPRVLQNFGLINVQGTLPNLGGRLAIGGLGMVTGINPVQYDNTTATLRFQGASIKVPTMIELPQTMQGSIYVDKAGGQVHLNHYVNAFGTVTSANGILSTSAATLRINSRLHTLPLGFCAINANGVVSMENGTILHNEGLCQVNGGGTLHFDGLAEALGTTIGYVFSSTLLYTGGGNKTPTTAEIPLFPVPFNGNLFINKSAGTFFDRPLTSDLLQIAGQLAITSGTVRTGRGVFWDIEIVNTSTAGITSRDAGFVQGPLRWQVSNLSPYIFPVGDAGTKLPFALINPGTVAPGTIVVAEAFFGNAGGTPVANISALSTTEYWRFDLVTGSIGRTQIGIYRNGGWGSPATVASTPPNTVSPGSVYSFLGGTPALNGLVSNNLSNLVPAPQRFFLAGQANLPVKSGFGYQLLFNAANQEVYIPPRPAYDSITTFTVEALINPYWLQGFPPGGVGDPCVLSFGSGTDINFSLHVGSFLSRVRVGNGSSSVMIDVTPNFQRYRYYHLAVTYSGGVVTVYIDGKRAGSANLALNSVMGRPLRIGTLGGQNTERWNGTIDEVRLWNTALPHSVIASWKRRELDNTHPNAVNLIGYWRLNEGFPQIATDYSPQANAGTLLGSPLWIDGSTTAGVIVPPDAASTGRVQFTKVGGGALAHALFGANGGSTTASVILDAVGNITYSPLTNPGINARDTVRHAITDGIPTSTTAIIIAEFSPSMTVKEQFVGYNKPTQFTLPTIIGGTTPFSAEWMPASGLVGVNSLQPIATLVTDATYTLLAQDGYGFGGSFSVPAYIHPMTLAFSHVSSTGTLGLPGLIASGNPFTMRYGVYRKRTGFPDSVSAAVALHVAAHDGGSAQFACAYDSSFTNADRVTAPSVVIHWLNAPLSGGTTQAVITLFRKGGVPLDAVQMTVVVSSNATLPIISSFAPSLGGNATFVIITGANFVNVNNVRFGGIPAQSFLVVSSTEIHAQPASGGASGLISVDAMTGTGNSSTPFTFVQAPTITEFTPTQGVSGATVRITGTNFIAPLTVRFGGVVGQNVDITSPTELYADVGLGATGNITVTTPGGTATSATIFTYFGAPFILAINPTQGTAGDTILVSGNNFTNVDSVRIGSITLNGSNGSILQPITPTALQIVLGSVALSGNITVYALGGQGASAQVFTYIPPPIVDSIAPVVGGAGTVVHIYGKHFVQVDSVRFGVQPLGSTTLLSSEQIRISMPGGLPHSTSALVVHTRAGADSSKTPYRFTYLPPPYIADFEPKAAGIGAWVQVTGANFAAVKSITVGGTSGVVDSIKALSPTHLLVKIPPQATNGKINIHTAGGNASSLHDFRLVLPPSISSFSPFTASSGATIEVVGQEFINVQAVKVGTVPLLNVSIPNDMRLLGVLPAGATTGIVSVETAQGVAYSSSPLQVIAPLGPTPSIVSFTPPAAEEGAEIFISGSNFINVSTVTIGGVSAGTVKTLSSTLLSVIVPEGASTGTLRVATPNGIAISAGVFQLLPRIVDAGLTPLQRDSSVLVKFYLASGGGWKNEQHWLSAQPISSWAGVRVEGERVVELRVSANNIRGVIPAFLAELSALKVLDLSHNEIEGILPSSIATLRLLEELYLSNNRLSGNVPRLSSMANLRVLALENNRFIGEFPPSLCDMLTLQEISLSKNAFSGVLPPCLAGILNLRKLDAAGNIFTGELPSEIAALPMLEELFLADNMLSGTLPPNLGAGMVHSAALYQGDSNTQTVIPNKPLAQTASVSRLRVLNLSKNQFSGAVPSSLGQAKELRVLNLSQNKFSGSLPQELGSCANLDSADISNNQIEGSIPTGWGGLQNVRYLSLKSNALSGVLPPEFGRLQRLAHLLLDSNRLTGLTDSLTRISTLRILTASHNRLQSLPRFSGLDSVNVAFNRLDFSALERLSAIQSFVYAPQDSVLERIDTTIRVFTSLTLSSHLQGGRYEYQWYKVLSTGLFQLAGRNEEELRFDRIVRNDTGTYVSFIRHSALPNLTLVRRRINVYALPPASPEEVPLLLAPQQNAQSIQRTPLLRWTTIATVSGYEVQIATRANFSNVQWSAVVNNPFAPTALVPLSANLQHLVVYYWRVRALSEGLPGNWSEVFRFTTMPENQPINVETLDFGRIIVNRSSKPFELTVRNLSSVPLLLHNVALGTVQVFRYQSQTLHTDTSMPFRAVQPFTPLRLEPDETVNIPFVFMPSVVGEYRANISASFSPAVGGGATTTLQFASAFIGRGGVLVIDTVDFGLITAGVRRTETIRIRNIGLDTVRLHDIRFDHTMIDSARVRFALAEQFSVQSLSVRPNDSLFVNVSCLTSAEAKSGSVQSSLTIYSSLDTVFRNPVLARIRRPNINDVTIATVLLPEKQNLAPGAFMQLELRFRNIASLLNRGLNDVYLAGTTPVFSGEIEFNAQVLVPDIGERNVVRIGSVGELTRYRIPPTRWQPVIPPSGEIRDSSLLRIRCRVVSGSTNTTPLRVHRLLWDTSAAVSRDAFVVVEQVPDSVIPVFTASACEAGGLRLTASVQMMALRVLSANPVQGAELVLSFRLREDVPAEIRLLDALGNTVHSSVHRSELKFPEYEEHIPISGLPSGAYTVVLRSGKASIARQVVILK